MRATSRRRFWSRRRRPILRCSTAPRARRPGGGTSPVLPERSHYFDAGVDQKIPFGCYSAVGTRLHHARSRRRRLLQDRDRPDRQRHFRPGAGAERLQLRQGHQSKASSSAPNTTAAISRPMATSPSARRRPPQVVSNQYLFDNATPHPRSRRLDRISVHRDALDLYRSQPVRDRLGRPVLYFAAGLMSNELWNRVGTRFSPT